MKYRPEIDGLRAIAVLAVVMYHSGWGLVPGGFVGVDVFFVISGYLITALLLREDRIDLLGFYARRVRRILPAMVAVVLVVLIASFFLLAPMQLQELFKSAGATLAMLANVYFQGATGGYFDPASDQLPLLHMWSLSVEEQFYLLWPALLMVVPRRWVRAVMVGLALCSLALAESVPSEVAFYQMPARFWELAAGGFIATLSIRLGRPCGLVCAYGGLAVLLWAVMIPTETFPGVGAIPAVVGSFALLLAIHAHADMALVGRFLRSRFMVFFGLISYSLYLWHWPLLALDKATRLGDQPLWVALLLCALAVPLAWLSWRYVETPFRKMGAPSLRTVGIGVTVAATLATASISLAAYSPHDRATLIAKQAMRDHPGFNCHYRAESPAAELCATAGARVVVWGDSHALAWTPLAESLGVTQRLTRDACPPMGGGELCDEFSRYAISTIRRLKPDVVVIAAKWPRYDLTELEATLRKVNARRVIVVGPTPKMKRQAAECIQRHLAGKCGMSRAEFEAYAGKARAMVAQAALNVGAEFVDPTEDLCTMDDCPMMQEGRSLYWDDDHVASSAVRRIVERRGLAASNRAWR